MMITPMNHQFVINIQAMVSQRLGNIWEGCYCLLSHNADFVFWEVAKPLGFSE